MGQAIFLPGAGGDSRFWSPVADRLSSANADQLLLDWPGFGRAPVEPQIKSLSDLVGFVLKKMNPPADVIAQSMGGVVAILLALDHPETIRRLVLTGTSGGIDMTQFQSADWRKTYVLDMPKAPRWFVDDRSDVASRLGSLTKPALLIWGEEDLISPVDVGKYLANALSDSRLVTIPGAGHDVAERKPDEVAELIRAFLYA